MAPAIDKHRLLSVAAAVVLGGAPTVCFYIYDTGTEASSLSSSLVLCCVSRALNLPIKIRFLPFFLSACHHENWAPPHYLVQYTLYCTGTAAVVVSSSSSSHDSFIIHFLYIHWPKTVFHDLITQWDVFHSPRGRAQLL